MNGLNVPLMQRTLAHLEAHPETFVPWFVGSGTGGFADWAAWLHCWGRVGPSSMPLFELPPDVATLPEIVAWGEHQRSWSMVNHGPLVTSWRVGRLLLGTDALLADDLYEGGNTVVDLHRIVGELCAAAGRRR